MDALVSGQAATAALIEGNDVSILRFNDGGLERTTFEVVGRIFAGCTDVKHFQGVDMVQVDAALHKSWSFDRAIRLTLIVLDDKEYVETKQEAASYLEELFTDPEVKTFVANQLAWAPLPRVAVVEEASIVGHPKVVGFFSDLLGKQRTVKVYHDSWEALPNELFESTSDRVSFREACISRGAFRKLTDSGEGTAQTNLAVLECYQLLHDKPNYRTIIRNWTQGSLKPRRNVAELDYIEDEELPYINKTVLHAGGHALTKPPFINRRQLSSNFATGT